MRQDKRKIYNQLLEYQQRFGGYTGKDLDEIARWYMILMASFIYMSSD
ncbi:MAG: hypothetical protein OIN83_03320 [Candidatus Methanoperedens sp.]|nr:hypothetical protein [Candidatus Methanoperedens sp.]